MTQILITKDNKELVRRDTPRITFNGDDNSFIYQPGDATRYEFSVRFKDGVFYISGNNSIKYPEEIKVEYLGIEKYQAVPSIAKKEKCNPYTAWAILDCLHILNWLNEDLERIILVGGD
jgi:hypothetical protein